MKKVFLFMLIVMFGMGMCFAEKLAVLPEITRPASLSVDDEQFYVTEGAIVHIYSLKDFSYKTKFGKEGEGPQEFKLAPGGQGLLVMPYEDCLMINSVGKISYFTKDGKFLKEIMTKKANIMGYFQPIGKRFVGFGVSQDQDSQSVFTTINLYDENFTKLKEISRQKLIRRGRFEFPFIIPVFHAYDNKILMIGETGFVINIFDVDGNKTSTIKREYKQLKVTDKYKERVHDFLKTNPSTRAVYEVIKNRIKFTDYFPSILLFYVDSKKIYILTYLEKDEKYETFIYGVNGKFIKKVFLPLRNRNGIQYYPHYIHNNKFYQLIDNEETEEWELHATKIE